MSTQVFVNLPVKDLGKSVEFFTRLGFTFAPQFSDETANCMILAENVFAILLTDAKPGALMARPIRNATKSTGVMLALSRKSRAEVDEIVGKAVAAGGSPCNKPRDDDFMYSHGFLDLDGHLWEPFFMEPDH